MVVAQLIGDLPVGGAERLFVDLFNSLECERKFVVLLSEPGEEPSLRTGLERGAEVYVLPIRKRYLLSDLLRLSRFLRKQNCDIVHTHMFWSNLYGAIAASLAGTPVVITSEHGRNDWKKPRHRFLERTVISRIAKRRLCVSTDILKCRRDEDGVPEGILEVMPNGTRVPDSIDRQEQAVPTIGSVGRLVPAKDYPTLVRAVSRLRNSGFQLRAEIVGDGPERQGLKRCIKAEGVEDAVTLVGHQQNVGKWLSRWTLFVSSSIREGQPVALLEAMAHGLACVATAVGGVPNTLRDKQEGLIVPSGDPGVLADAIGALLSDQDKRAAFGAAGRQRVIDDFSIESLALRVREIYEQLLSQREIRSAT